MLTWHSIKNICLSVLLITLLSACSYHSRNIKLMSAFEQKDYVKAEGILTNKKWEKRKHNILLYYLNKGTVLHMLGKYKESNEYFQRADYYIEDYHKNYALKALTFISNPSIEPYGGENYEKILLHYYSTLNYLKLGQPDDALIECKRMLLVMDNISTYYKKNNKYNRDAFTHLLLGLIYDAQKNYENAFIAYRNAYEVYKEDYKKLLGTDIPLQLKKDLLRTAYLNHSYSELDLYEQEFGFKYDPSKQPESSLVCFWNNGLCPVKEQNSITFLITDYGNGTVMFTNLELGMNIPFYVGEDKDKIKKLVDMQAIRVAFPKFISRPPLYQTAYLKTATDSIPMQLAENIDAIAQRSLHDRMLKELGEALLRLALKKVAEIETSKNNQGLGTALNIVDALSEQADTRNWQFLPFSINYIRVPLNEGKNSLVLKAFGNGPRFTDSLTVDVTKSQTFFESVTSY
jgi:hypothetical protein